MGIVRPAVVSHLVIHDIASMVELTGVPFVKNSPRAPLGPSVVFMEGIPFSGIAIVRQKSAPASSDI
jgi:hypothetical protein